jgi:hypothetical protein
VRGDGGRDGGREQPGDYGAAQEEPDPGFQHQEAAVLLRQPRQGEDYLPFFSICLSGIVSLNILSTIIL